MNGGLSMVEMKRKYKKSEYGLIPVDWKEGTFADFLEGFSAGATPYRGITSNFKGKIKWISSGELNYNRINDTIEHISEEAFTKTSLKIHPEGTFLMAITGLEAAGTRGRCAFVGNPAATNQSCMAIYPTDKMINEYLYYFYRKYSEILANKYCQGTKQKSYTSNIVKLLPIVCPPSIKEQASIAAALSDVDSLISALTKKIEKKKAIKQGLMQQLLTGKKRLPGFCGDWMTYSIEELFELGNGYTPSKAISSFWFNGTIPWFRMEDIRLHGRILKDSIQHITLKAVKGGRLFPKDSIILSTTATIGEHAWLNVDSLANQRFTFLMRKRSCCDTISVKYFFYYCYILGDWCRANINEGGLMAVNMEDLRKYNFAIPPTISEQTAIANILSDCDSEIAALEEKRDKYKEIKQGMMQQLLTGKIRLI